MGWNSWNTFGTNISDQLIRETADAMVDQGYLAAGYEYLVIDDCWSLRDRDENGKPCCRSRKVPLWHEGRGRLCAFQGSQVRYVQLRRHNDLRGLSVQL